MARKRAVLVGLAAMTLLDIASATAAEPVPVYNWTGFYFGGHAGYRWAHGSFFGPGYDFDTGFGIVSFPPRNESFNLDGGIIGIQGGYNFMLTPQILGGIEGDWSWGSRSRTLSNSLSGLTSFFDGFTFNSASEVKLTWQATIRGRLGYVNGPWNFYGTGGVAFTHVDWSGNATLDVFAGGPPPIASFATSWSNGKTLTGWVLGGGIEYMFTQNWIGRIEYLYENFGSFNVPFDFSPQLGTLDLKDVSKIRFAISYKFGQ